MVDFARLRREGPLPIAVVPREIVAVTGHRPPKIGGYDWGNPVRVWLRQRLNEETGRLLAAPRDRSPNRLRATHADSYLRTVDWRPAWREPMACLDEEGGERTVERWRCASILGLTGVALGFDQDAAGEWRRMGVPYVAVVPFPGQEARWPAEAQRVYARVLECAAGVVHVVPSGRNLTRPEAVAALLKRNEWLQCVADHLVAGWDGSGGGTGSCVAGWRRMGNTAIVIDPRGCPSPR